MSIILEKIRHRRARQNESSSNPEAEKGQKLNGMDEKLLSKK